MSWRLEVFEGPDKGLAVSLGASPINIGRDPSSSQLVFTDTSVSRLHAKATLTEGDAVFVEDLGSSHGTYLNGQKTSGKFQLNPSDQVKIGNNKLRLSQSVETPASLPGIIPSAVITIGRKANNNLVINEPKVSRSHARLEKQGDLFYLIDLNSTHGTYLNGKRIKGSVAIAPSSWVHICGINYYFDGVNLKTEQGSVAATLGKAPGSGFLANLSVNSIKTVKPVYLAFASALLVFVALSSFLLISQGGKGGPAIQMADSISGFQQYSLENVTISMLEGTIPEGSSVIIKRNNKPPSLGDPSILAEAYDITMPPGSFTDGVNSISMPYNASKISRELVAEDNIAAVYFSEQDQAWMPVAFDIDPGRGIVIIYPDHFTTYAVIYYTDGREALLTRPQSELPFTSIEDGELQKIIADMNMNRDVSDAAIQAGFKSFYDTFRLQKATVTFIDKIFGPSSLKLIEQHLSLIGYGVAAIKIANDVSQNKYLDAAKTINTTSIGYLASKYGLNGLKIASLGVVVIDIALGQFGQKAIDENLVKWETAYQKYYKERPRDFPQADFPDEVGPRTASDWYRITKKIWDKTQDHEKFKQLLDAELKKYTYGEINVKGGLELFLPAAETGIYGLFPTGGDKHIGRDILTLLSERHQNEIKLHRLKPALELLLKHLEREARKELRKKNEALYRLMNKRYQVTVILENHKQVKDLHDTSVNFVSLSGKILHSQSFDENGEVVLPMTLYGILENEGPTRVEVMIKAQPEKEEFRFSKDYLFNIEEPEILIRVPYGVDKSLKIIAPQDIIDGSGVIDTNYTFEAVGTGIPDTAYFSWKINGGETGGNGNALTSSFSSIGDYTIECSASWMQRAADGSSYEERIAAEPIVVSIKEIPEDVDIKRIELDICGEWKVAESGGAGTTVAHIDISKLPVGSSFDLKYNTVGIPDKFTVEYEGAVVFDSGWRGNQSHVDNNPGLYPGGLSGPVYGTEEGMFTKNIEDTFVVTVYGPESNTQWNFELRANCPPAGE